VVCRGDAETLAYVLNWLAAAVQRPGQPVGTMVVLRGDQGCGKGIVATYLSRIFKDYYMAVTQRRHITGQFNAHLAHTLLLFADEAFFAGDHETANVLKGLITDSRRVSEGKYRDAVPVRNCLNIIAATNSDWVCPAERTDRRFCVLHVDASRRGDPAYFHNIAGEMDAGGPAALMHDLLARDISGFRPAVFPRGSHAERWNQKRQSLSRLQRWWLSCLEAAELPEPFHETVQRQPFSDVHPTLVPRSACWAAYKHGGFKGPFDTEAKLGDVLRKLVMGDTAPVPARKHHGVRHYEFPPLPVCRRRFAAYFDTDIQIVFS
jgi:hypothetical protein